VIVVGSCGGSACSGGLFGKSYEYEEDLRLSVDGAATVDLNASVAALIALRGVDLPLDPSADIDRDAVRALFDGPHVEVTSVRLTRRDGRTFVHVRIEVEDINTLSRLAPFSWSTYSFLRRGDELQYRQVVGAPASREVGDVGWDGSEVVAFRLHLPSVISFHNAPSKTVRRGNLLEWEQSLAERRRGTPIEIQVHMEPDSILYTTLLLFGSTVVLAALAFGIVIWRVARHGRDNAAGPPAPGGPAAHRT